MRTIVPGVREIIHPEGRLTFELFDERMKLLHKTEAENTVHNQFLEAIATALRGQSANQSAGNIGAIGFDQMEGAYNVGDTDNIAKALLTSDPRIYCRHYQFCNGLYLSSSATAVNADWWYPIGLEAGAGLTANNTFVDNKRRGGRVLGSFVKQPDKIRYVIDFGLNAANGFSVESAGLAGLQFPSRDTYDGVFGWLTGNALTTPSNGVGQVRVRTYAPVPGSKSRLWILGDDGSYELDLSINTSGNWGNTSSRSIVGPSLATWGSPSATNSGIAIIGTDFWMMDTLRLRRFNVPTSSSLPTLNNTYSPVTGFTDAACLGMCSDGTDLYAVGSTKVFKISTSTGAVTSSWAHSITGAINITYDPTHDCVWIAGGDHATYTRDGYGVYGNTLGTVYPNETDTGSTGGFGSAWPFSKTGTALGEPLQPIVSTNGGAVLDTLVLMDSGRIIVDFLSPFGNTSFNHIHAQSGGVLGTRAIVGSPFTKTSSQILRVTYDLLFSALP